MADRLERPADRAVRVGDDVRPGPGGEITILRDDEGVLPV